MPLGLYLHIPFCHARCGYCDFVTFTGKESQIDAYVDALCQEIHLYSSRLDRQTHIDTLFFGGGTPSVLEPSHLEKIFQTLHQNFTLAPGAEVTLEANPESVTLEKACAWRAVGINRLSLGLQAYDDALLKAMGRLHDVAGFERAYALLRAEGFANLSIDLIYGFPGQTLEGWKSTVGATIALEPEHLSLYSLKVEEHTPFAAAGATVDEDLQADMYNWARAFLPAKGYDQYEISNFSRPGKACQHNLIYWRAQDYLGLGVGAVGCVGGVRWQNIKTLDAYLKAVQSGSLPRASEEALDPRTQKLERLMLGLRLREGLEWDEEDNAQWFSTREKLKALGQLEQDPTGRWRVSDPYIPLTHQVLLPFF